MSLTVQKELILLDNLRFKIYDGVKIVNFSGGIDSTLVLYLLMKYSVDDLLLITKAVPHKNIELSTRVVKRVTELTNRTNILHTMCYTPGVDIDKNHYYQYYNFNVMYTGLTENPPEEVFNSWEINNNTVPREAVRDKLATLKDPLFEINNHYVYNPFINCNKRDIKQIYDNEGIVEDLFPLTHSCVYEEDPGLNHCGECWWCRERQWGFGKL